MLNLKLRLDTPLKFKVKIGGLENRIFKVGRRGEVTIYIEEIKSLHRFLPWPWQNYIRINGTIAGGLGTLIGSQFALRYNFKKKRGQMEVLCPVDAD